MERRVEFVGSIIIFFVLLFVYSKWGPAIPFSTTTQSKGEPMIVSGEGKVKVTPDTAVVNFGIEDQGQNLKALQDRVNKKSQDLIKEIQKLGIEDKNIKTTSYNIYPENDYGDGQARIVGYRVSINYEVRIEDFDKINDTISTITQNGANVVSGISFELSEELKTEKLNEAREIAAKEAKNKAEGLAKAAGITLGKIINVSENQAGGYPAPMYEKMAVGMGGSDTTNIAPEIKMGQTEISVMVNLSYEVR